MITVIQQEKGGYVICTLLPMLWRRDLLLKKGVKEGKGSRVSHDYLEGGGKKEDLMLIGYTTVYEIWVERGGRETGKSVVSTSLSISYVSIRGGEDKA